MKTHHGLRSLGAFRNTAITVGTFDGVHLGHLSVVQHLKTVAAAIGGESVVVTFDVPPRSVTMPWAKSNGILTSLEEKIQLFAGTGISHLIIIPFTLEFSKLSPEAFIRDILIARAGMKAIVPGYDHIFGHGGSGGVEVLRTLAIQFGFRVEQSPEFRKEGAVVSSSYIRGLISDGKLAEANNLLGYSYSIGGKVVYGKQLGRTIGFPTINVEKDNGMKITPGNGVYAVEVVLGEGGQLAVGSRQLAVGSRQLAVGSWQLAVGSWQLAVGSGQEAVGSGETADWRLQTGNCRLKGMCNVGMRPTVNGKGLTIEVNLFDFKEDLYGETVRIFFVKKVRDERKFGSLDELKAQLAADKALITDFFSRP